MSFVLFPFLCPIKRARGCCRADQSADRVGSVCVRSPACATPGFRLTPIPRLAYSFVPVRIQGRHLARELGRGWRGQVGDCGAPPESNFYMDEVKTWGIEALLDVVDEVLDEARRSGLIAGAIERAGLSGVDVAPPRDQQKR
jgi:hypothetical protein